MSDTNTTNPAPTTSNDSWGDTQANDNWDTPEVVVEQETTTKGPEPKETKEEKKQKRYLTAKVNGKEERVDEETLIRDYQKYKAADQKFAEASKAEKSVKAFMEALQNDPEAVLNNPNLSIDRKKLAEKWLYEQIQQELNPPDERDQKLREYEEKLKGYQSKEQEEVATKEQAEYQQVVAKRKNELANVFSEAMSKSSLSKNPETAAATLREMALYYRAYKEQTGEAPDANELAQHVEQKYFKGLYELANTLEGDELVQFLGPQIIKKLRAYDLGQLTKKSSNFEPSSSKTEDDWGSKFKSNKKITMSPQDAKEQVRKHLLGK